MLSVLNRILWLQPLPFSFCSIDWCLELEGWVVSWLTLGLAVMPYRWIVGLLGTALDSLVTKACGLVGGTPRPSLQ